MLDIIINDINVVYLSTLDIIMAGKKHTLACEESEGTARQTLEDWKRAIEAMMPHKPTQELHRGWRPLHARSTYARPVSLPATLSLALDAGPMGFGFAAADVPEGKPVLQTA